MRVVQQDEWHDWWEVELDSPFHRLHYYFELFDGQETCLFYGDVFTDHLVDDRSEYFKLPFDHRADRAVVPAWTVDAVVYNIFPDSFATGHRSISGRPTRVCGCEGLRGGTLRGVRENLDYLEQLGVNCLYLNPIFVAGPITNTTRSTTFTSIRRWARTTTCARWWRPAMPATCA